MRRGRSQETKSGHIELGNRIQEKKVSSTKGGYGKTIFDQKQRFESSQEKKIQGALLGFEVLNAFYKEGSGGGEGQVARDENRRKGGRRYERENGS